MTTSTRVNIGFVLVVATVGIVAVARVVPFWIYITIGAIYVAIQAYGSTVLSASFFTRVTWRGDVKSKSIALTFDDGPIPGDTDSIIEILNDHGVSAAFFCIGSRMEQHATLIAEMHGAGHLICNHSYSHSYTFDLQSAGRIGAELEKTDAVIKRITGEKCNFFRPPYGVTNPMVASAIAKGKYITVGWSIRSFDTVITDSKKLLERVTHDLKGGDIILLHDHGRVTRDMLPALLEHIASVGLKIVRLDQLINEKAYA